MSLCVIPQPIHAVGVELLRAAGIEVCMAPGPEQLAEALGRAKAVIVRDGLSEAQIDSAPRLRVIANHGTGTDKVAVLRAHALGIPVTYLPDVNVLAVAEHAFTLMLAAAHNIVAADAATRAGNWRFKYDGRMVSLYGKTMGIIGYGRTGKLLGDMASRGLGMRVLVWSPSADGAAIAQSGASAVATLAELLAQSDVVSLHRPLRADTRHTLDRAHLAMLQPHAIVVNTSRGGLIDEAALADALRHGRLAGAGLDVFEHEPLPVGADIASLPNVVLTPHVAGSSQEALQATARRCAQQVIDVLAGRLPEHMLAPDVWERRRQPA